MEKISDMRLAIEGDRFVMRWAESNNGWAMTASETAELIKRLQEGLAVINPSPSGAKVGELRHSTKDTGDCPSWCAACRVESEQRAALAAVQAPGVGASDAQHIACEKAHRWLLAHEWKLDGKYFVKIGHCETMGVDAVALIVGAALASAVSAAPQDGGRDTERQLAIGRAVERACTDLPDLYEISIDLEKDAGTVRLYAPDAESIDFDQDFDSFGSKIDSAIDAARSQHQEEAK